MEREEFRLDRVNRMTEVSNSIYRIIDDAQAQTIGGDAFAEDLEPLLALAFMDEYLQRASQFASFPSPSAAWKWAWQRLRPGIVAASDLADPRRIADWLGTAIVNAAAIAAAKERPAKEWVSRHDDRVRPFHVEADGQTVGLDEKFTVCDGREMDFPGQPVGDPDCWINCRCVVRTVSMSTSASSDMIGGWTSESDSPNTQSPVPMAASTGPATATATATGSSSGSDFRASQRTALPTGLPTTNSPRSSGTPATVPAASTLTTSSAAPKPTTWPTWLNDGGTGRTSGRTAPTGTPTRSSASATAHAATAPGSASARSATGSTPTSGASPASGDRSGRIAGEVATGNHSQNVPVEQAAFAADPDVTGVCIVALPAVDDPVNAASSEPVAHMTVVWLGKQVFSPEDRASILAGIVAAAGEAEPVDARIVAREELGEDNADVVKVDPGPLAGVRDRMLADPAIGAAHNAVEQYPQWTPHVTLGYPDSPAKGDPGESILFDRLALWDKEYEGEEFPMTAVAEDVVEELPDAPEMSEEDIPDVPVPWYGVLAPEGVYSGDGRKFAEGALDWRDLPLPLLWQEKSGMGHEGSVVVGQIADIWRDGNLVHASGTFAQTDAADEVIGLLAEGHLRGVSVDVDNAEMAMEDEDSENMLFSKGRICAGTLVPIPAFHEAFVSLGTSPSHGETVTDEVEMSVEEVFISEEPWDGSASRFTPEQWKASCCLHIHPEVEPKSNHKLPIKEPGGALSRAGTHAAAGRINQVEAPPEAKSAAKSRLRGAYSTLGEEPPDVLKASAEPSQHETVTTVNASAGYITYARGPGWITDPIPTKRIHDYWTKPGHEGYNKVAWGTPGDFRRLRAYLSKYIGPRFLNRTTAQWHHDALGYWPGEEGLPGNPPIGSRRARQHIGETVDAAVILASANVTERSVPGSWFTQPSLSGPSPITVTDEGRIFGHLATWGTCHIGIPGTCVEPPNSAHEYAYFRTGVVATEDGPVPCGQITMECGHAPISAGARAAASHYDNTGTVVADVACGEDEHGIWIAGALRPGLSSTQVQALRAGALSGDWRAIGGSLELVAALVVNVPGFPIPRVGLAASGGVQSSLVAAGIVVAEAGGSDDVAEFVQAVADEVEARTARRARAARLLDDTRATRVEALLTSVEA